jgi:hypothetical protein
VKVVASENYKHVLICKTHRAGGIYESSADRKKGPPGKPSGCFADVSQWRPPRAPNEDFGTVPDLGNLSDDNDSA